MSENATPLPFSWAVFIGIFKRVVEDLLEKRDPDRKAVRATKREKVKVIEVKAKGKFVQDEDEKDFATSAQKGFDVGGDIGLMVADARQRGCLKLTTGFRADSV